jgi:CRP-like cAMP-binding protein
LDLFCADDDGERRVLSRLSLEVRREVRLWSMRDVLNQQPFFRDDPAETFVKLCTDSLKRRFFGPNEVIVGAGEIGRELFFLSRGDAEVRTRRGRRVRALPEGAMFGEIALVLSMASDDENERGPKEASERRRITQPPPRERSSARGGSRGDVRKKCKTIRRTADVRTSAFVETLVLSDAAYIRAAAAAPETAAEVERLARERFRSVNAARWRSATLAVIAANAILRNAGFPSVARGRVESDDAF